MENIRKRMGIGPIGSQGNEIKQEALNHMPLVAAPPPPEVQLLKDEATGNVEVSISGESLDPAGVAAPMMTESPEASKAEPSEKT